VTGKYLLCQEFANQGFWCPGGAVDPGETLAIAAIRETIEEAGIEVVLKGILAMEYNPCGLHWRNGNYLVRLRVIYYAEPSSQQGMFQLPKSCPDFESAGACWCSFNEIQSKLKLRGSEPKTWTR
jgi:8-oxo-dGTP pyrophosphatase MutT (NUDIX family)